MGKTVFLQSHTLPLGQRVYDLRLGVALLLDAEGDRALHTVQVIVEAGGRIDEQRCGHAQQMQLFRQQYLKKIFHSLDADLRIVQIQRRLVIFGNH